MSLVPEFAALSRLGISDARAYIKKTCKNAIILNSCCVSESCLESLDIAIEECLTSGTFINAMVTMNNSNFRSPTLS